MKRSLALAVVIAVGLMAAISVTTQAGDQPHRSALPTCTEPSVQQKISRDPELDAWICQTMAESHIPGAAIVAFCTDRIYYEGYFGYAQLEDSIPVTDLTTFCVASVSKTVTGTAGLQVWEDTGVSLDADIRDFFGFNIVHPTCPDSAMTFRHVYTHTAGLPRDAPGIPAGQAVCQGMADLLDPFGQYYDQHVNAWQEYCPGQGYHYSNIGPTLIACFVAEHGGPTFPDYCQTNLFAPLSMDNTHWFGYECDPEHVAYSYFYDAEADTYGVDSYGGVESFIYPAAGLRTTARDLAHHTMAIMQGGRLGETRILDEATTEQILTVQLPRVAPERGLIWGWHYNPALQDSCWRHLGAQGCYSAGAFICARDDMDFGVVAMANGSDAPGSATGRDLIVGAVMQYISNNLEDCDSGPVAAPAVPERFRLHPIHPNPFNPRTTISFTLDREMQVRLAVYDLTGRRITILAEQSYCAGRHAVTWDGCGTQRRALASGTYVVRLETDSGVEARKVMLLR